MHFTLDQILKEKWVDTIAKELVFLYGEKLKSEQKRNEKIIIFEEKNIFYFEIIRKFKNIITIEIFRILVYLSTIITNLFLKKNERKIKHIQTDLFFLAQSKHRNSKGCWSG